MDAVKSQSIAINARTESVDEKPTFKNAFRSRRCLIPADGYYEWATELGMPAKQPFYISRTDKKTLAFAGIWDSWKNPESNELIYSFAIITTVANEVTQMIHHHRSPVILHRDDEKRWLSDLPLSEVTRLLVPYPGELMNAFPIAPTIKNPLNDDPGLIHPVGQRILPETIINSKSEIRITGMGSNKNFGFDEHHPLGN